MYKNNFLCNYAISIFILNTAGYLFYLFFDNNIFLWKEFFAVIFFTIAVWCISSILYSLEQIEENEEI